jgi:prepilin-type N-terminal cleavage/methylation domain-containing protein
MSIWSRRRGDEGFTLIELAVAIGLFGLVLLSLSLLFDRALETTRRVQSDQIGKTLAQEKLEETRSLPFFVSQKTNPNDVDLLDRYFPDDVAVNPTPTGAVGTYDGTAGVYAFTSTETLVRAGVTYTRRTVVQLGAIKSDGTFDVQAPVADYTSNVADQDDPGPRAAKVAATVSFTSQGQARSVTLQTIVANTKNDQPKVQASASVTGAQISGVTFQDGDPAEVAGAVSADVLSQIGLADLNFREVTGPSAQASADPVEIIERRADNNNTLQSGPTAGSLAATAPNSTTGNTQVVPSPPTPLTAGNMLTVNPSPQPSKVVIAAWGQPNPQASGEARVSFQHTLNPESRAVVAADDFLLNARDPLELAPLAVIQIGAVDGSVEQTSTITSAHTKATAVIEDVTIWASRSFGASPNYEGTVQIDRIFVEVESDASTSAGTTHVHWRVDDLRVWDPDKGGNGGYEGPWTFGFDHDCGGWVGTQPAPGDPACGNFVNPNPVVIPVAYQGTDADGNPGTSLVIVAGATVQDTQADASQGVSSASAGQQNVLSISTRDDIAGAAVLEPSLAGLGAANSSVSYVSHSH